MNRQTLIQKISSRKFWALIAAFVAAIMLATNASAGEIEKITAIISAFGAVVAYIFAEAMVDREAVKNDLQRRK